MTGFALGLVLLSAVLHASWNLLAKRSGGDITFVWLADTLSVLFYAPVTLVVFFADSPHIGWVELLFILVSSTLHLGYFILLMRGYRLGDLSLVYPLARGTGPVLSLFAAILFFGERPGLLAIGGALMVALGVFLLAGGPKGITGAGTGQAVAYGLFTGGFIAAYTLWDKVGVSALFIPPVLYYTLTTLGRITILAPYIARRWDSIRHEWATHRIEALGVGLFSPLSYILVLTALSFSLVSYIAPAREVSILLGAIMGARFLAEGDASRRIIASCAVVAGIAALALG